MFPLAAAFSTFASSAAKEFADGFSTAAAAATPAAAIAPRRDIRRSRPDCFCPARFMLAPLFCADCVMGLILPRRILQYLVGGFRHLTAWFSAEAGRGGRSFVGA